METNELFEAVLGLHAPWRVADVTFDPKGGKGRGQVDIRVEFPAGSRFPCASCGGSWPLHDTVEKTWRHLDLFQHLTYVHARVPRTCCGEHGVHLVKVPWARPGSGFTLHFEAYFMMLAPAMPMAQIADVVGEHDTRLWRVAGAHVERARTKVDMSRVEGVLVDETARSRGQCYVTIFADATAESSRVLFVTDGRGSETFHAFCADLSAHGGSAAQVRDVAMDMSAAFLKGATETMPMAQVTYDRFHVMKLIGDAVDEVRRIEVKERPELKGTRFDWLRNPGSLSAAGCERVISFFRMNLRTAKAYQLRLNLQNLWSMPSAELAREYLRRWCTWATRVTKSKDPTRAAGFEPLRRAVQTIRSHTDGILAYYRRHMTTGFLEGINSLVQAARARARGYRNIETFKTMVYLIAGKLDFELPALTHTK